MERPAATPGETKRSFTNTIDTAWMDLADVQPEGDLGAAAIHAVEVEPPRAPDGEAEPRRATADEVAPLRALVEELSPLRAIVDEIASLRAMAEEVAPPTLAEGAEPPRPLAEAVAPPTLAEGAEPPRALAEAVAPPLPGCPGAPLGLADMPSQPSRAADMLRTLVDEPRLSRPPEPPGAGHARTLVDAPRPLVLPSRPEAPASAEEPPTARQGTASAPAEDDEAKTARMFLDDAAPAYSPNEAPDSRLRTVIDMSPIPRVAPVVHAPRPRRPPQRLAVLLVIAAFVGAATAALTYLNRRRPQIPSTEVTIEEPGNEGAGTPPARPGAAQPPRP